MAIRIPQVPRVREAITDCIGDDTLTAALADMHYAVKVDTGVVGDLKGKPRVALTDTNDALDVYGEYRLMSSGEHSIQTGGTLVLRSTTAYVLTNNGFGVRSSATDGSVEVAGTTIGAGFGRIIGGGAVEIDGTDVNVFVVDADA